MDRSAPAATPTAPGSPTPSTWVLIAIPALVLAVALVVAGAGVYTLRHSVMGTAERDLLAAAQHAADALATEIGQAEASMTAWHEWLGAGGHQVPLVRQAEMLHALLAAEPEIVAIGWRESDERSITARRIADGLVIEVVAEGERQVHRFSLESFELEASEAPVEAPAAPRWPEATADGDGTMWSGPYPLAGGTGAGLTAARTLRDADGRLLGVAAVELSLASLAPLMEQLGRGCRGTVLISDNDGTLLAHSSPPESTGDGGLPRIDQMGDDVLPALMAALAKHDPTSPLHLHVAGADYLSGTRRGEFGTGLHWHAAAFAPTEALLTPDRRLRQRAAAVAAVGLLAAIACAWLLARSIRRHRAALRRAHSATEAAEARVRALGSYQLLRQLGAGGMGEVWLARHRLLARPAAIKLIQPARLARQGHTDIETAIARFQREARTTATLRSRHTVEIYDFGVTGDGTFYLVMELLEGLDLYDLVARYGLPPLARVVDLLRQACRSLAEAHDHGLVHRDIKPSNLFLCRRADEVDILKVLDFGMALDRDERDSQRLTDEGFVSGTPGFMAPEQARGQAVDGRSDLYALGCVGYFLLTGQVVFDRQGAMDQMMAHVNDPPQPPSQRADRTLPGSLENLILSCLSKDPAQRPQDARELDAALAAVVVPQAENWGEDARRAWWAAAEYAAYDPDELERAEVLQHLPRTPDAVQILHPPEHPTASG